MVVVVEVEEVAPRTAKNHYCKVVVVVVVVSAAIVVAAATGAVAIAV